MPRIVCLGMSALDAIYRVPAIPTTPTKVLATGFTECGGGMAANASVAVARLGGAVRYWGRVGDDALGDRILAELGGEGVDVASVRRIAGCVSPSAAILVDDDGERLVCAYNDPALDTDPSWLPLGFARCDAVLGDVRWPEGARAVFDAAAKRGVQAVFDGDIGPRDALLELAQPVTHAVFSEPGLARATGHPRPGHGLGRDRKVAHGIVGVTLGADGFLWREGGGSAGRRVQREGGRHARRRRRLARRVHARPGGGADVASGSRLANAAAAIKCSRGGGRRGAPTRAEVSDVLAGFELMTLINKLNQLITNNEHPSRSAVPSRPQSPLVSAYPERRRASLSRSAASAGGRFAPSFANSASCDASSRPHTASTLHHVRKPFRAEVEARPIEIEIVGLEAERRIAGAAAPAATLDDPAEHAHVLTEARPGELAVLVRAKPVDGEDLRRPRDLLAHREPVREIVADVITAEREHRERIAPHFADRAGGSRRGFRAHGRRLVDALLPCRACTTSGTVSLRRAPKMNASIGTPSGLSQCGSSEGHWVDGR